MKNMKIMFLIVLLAAAPFFAFTQQYEAESDFKVTVLQDNKSVLINEYTGSKQSINIPPQIKQLPVTQIGENAFQNKGLKSVSIPDSVTFIGPRAFMNNQLTSIIIPNSVIRISHRAFMNNQLTSVNIGSSVTHIENSAFENNQLTTVTIPDSVSQIFESAFAGNKLTAVIISDDVIYIRNEAFLRNQLTKLTIGRNIRLDDRAFDNQFTRFYNTTGRKAGTYVFINNLWSLETSEN